MKSKQKEYKTFTVNGKQFKAVDCVDGVLIDPKLPKDFDCTANDYRPATHNKFLNLPYIVTYSDADFDPASHTDEYADLRRKTWAESGRAEWFKAWPSGIRYDVRCLDGGAWDRSTNWGGYATLEEALKVATTRKPWSSTCVYVIAK